MSSLKNIGERCFPAEMTNLPLWLIYKLVDRGNGKFGKPPMNPRTGIICDKTDEGMYTDFDRAILGVEQHDADGVGFIFTHGFVAIDLDNCFDEDGNMTSMAADIFDHFRATYSELSPSGEGLHIFCQGTKPNDRTRTEGLEVYSGKNFVTVTGNHLPQSGEKVLNMQKELDWLFETYLPTAETPVISKTDVAFDHGDKEPSEWLEIGLTRDEKLNRLYTDTDHMDDESGHDLALMCKLAFWLNRDPEAIEDAFFESPWVHSKDYKHLQKVTKRDDYLETTISKAITTTKVTALENERKYRNIPEIRLRVSETSDGEIVIPLEDYTDVANAKAFADMYRETLAYTKEWGWCSYNGTNWEVGQEFQAQQCGVEFGESVMYIAKQTTQFYLNKCEENGTDPHSTEGKKIMAKAAALMKHAQRSNSDSGIKAMLNLAKGMLLEPASVFDSNGWELNTPNVVVDLRTGEIYPPTWNQHNTMMTTIPYDPDAEEEGMWSEFLNTIFCGDENLIDFMQVVLGAACVGKVYEENLTIANGSGSNGKSTLFGIISGVLGDYSVSINPDILMNKAGYEQQIALAQIKGKRLVIGQETESGQQLSTASVKRMVSSDNMVGRVLNHGYIEFIPTHSTILATNHLPKVRDDDPGTWRRLTVIPFNATISSKDMITNFQDLLLKNEGAYIMKWLVDGAIRFYENGCTFGEKPFSVRFASDDYRQAQKDSVDLYFSECVEFVTTTKGTSNWVKPSDVYNHYKNWCEENGVTKPLSRVTLGRKMEEHGMKPRRISLNGTTVRTWGNIILKNDEDEKPIAVEF